MQLFFSLLKAIRPLNLVLIGITQWVILSQMVYQVIGKSDGMRVLSPIDSILFICTTLLITAGGYLINDYYDQLTDSVNEKIKSITGRQLLISYIVTVIIGAAIATYLAFVIGKLHLVLIFPFSVALLYFYSSLLKSKVVIGNVIVALFTSFVPAIILVAEPSLLNQVTPIKWITSSIISFSIFSFLINLVREIIKDIEDINGDIKASYKSIPIVYGILSTKWIASILIILLVLGVVAWSFWQLEFIDFRIKVLNLIFICAPLIMAVFRLFKYDTKVQYHSISTLLKWIMLAGIISLLATGQNILNLQ